MGNRDTCAQTSGPRADRSGRSDMDSPSAAGTPDLVPHRHQDACWLPGLQERHHLVGFGILEILLHELVSPALVVIARGSIQKRNAPFFGSVLEPILERIGAFRQAPPGDPFPLPIGVEKAKPALAWLERLSPSIQPHAIQAAVPELKAILVMLDEGVHSPLLCGERPGAYRRERLRGQRSLYGLMGYQGRSPWLVRKAPGILTHLRDVKHGILLASMFRFTVTKLLMKKAPGPP